MSDNTPNPPQKSEVVETTWLKPSLFGGRFTRKQYFWRVLLVAIIGGIIGTILQQILVTPPDLGEMMRNARSIERYQQELMQVGLLTNIPVAILFYLPFGIKRAHDIGHKGSFLITLFAFGIIVQVIYAFVGGVVGSILYGIILIPAFIYGCILLFKDSQKGTNAYGPSLKYPDTTV